MLSISEWMNACRVVDDALLTACSRWWPNIILLPTWVDQWINECSCGMHLYQH
jgi:hypothetical protein